MTSRAATTCCATSSATVRRVGRLRVPKLHRPAEEECEADAGKIHVEAPPISVLVLMLTTTGRDGGMPVSVGEVEGWQQQQQRKQQDPPVATPKEAAIENAAGPQCEQRKEQHKQQGKC